jgi:anaerobic selenocysteine-containing dehydrogenase
VNELVTDQSDVRRTACNRDCPDACSLLVTVEEGRATQLRGDPEDPVTRGFLCERTSRFLSRQYDSQRFTQPLLRQGDAWGPVSWDVALDLAAKKLHEARAEFGPASVLHYRSGGSLGLLKMLADYFFEQFGPVTVKHGDVCSAAGDAAQIADFGVADSHDLQDILHSRLIVVWGKNPHTSGVHLLPVLNEARKRGAVLVGVDPVRTKIEGLCTQFLQPRPGGDFGLAMGVARRLFDEGREDPAASEWCDHLEAYRELVHARDIDGWAAEAGVPADALRELADLYGERAPAAILVGWGLARRSNGSKTVRALDALGAISGNLGVPGGGVSYDYARRAAFDLEFVRGEAAAPRTFPEYRLGREILEARDPPVRVAWITAGNPVSMLPDSSATQQALSEVPFTVVVETHPTDTTDCADLILPTLTLLEDSDLLGAYGNHWLHESRPAVMPPEGCRHELDILQGLAKRLGLSEALSGSVDDWKQRLTKRLDVAGAGVAAMRAGPVRNPFASHVLFEGRRVPTPSGRVNLLHERAEPAPQGSEDFPLLLMAISVPEGQSSQWSVPVEGLPKVRVHPQTQGVPPDGALAHLESAVGKVPVAVQHDERVRAGVVLAPKGGMLRDGRCLNLLIRPVPTDDGGGAAFYEEPVRLLYSEEADLP